MKGKVKFFNTTKGFGFIQAEDGKEYFVHQTGIDEGVVLREDDSVSFEVVDGERGPKAINVSIANDDAPAQEEAAPEESNEEESDEFEQQE